MAPQGRRGGGGGSSSGSGSSSSSSSSCGGDWPCSDDFRAMYGHGGTSAYSSGEMYGQLVVYIIWALVLAGLLIKSWTMKARAKLLFSALATLLCSFAFLCARFGLIVADASVPIGYRYEAAIIDLLWKGGIVLLFATLVHYTKLWKPLRLGFWAFWAIFAVIQFAYVVLSFILSNDAMNNFKQVEPYNWYYSDRDFGLTYSSSQIDRLKINGRVGLRFPHLQDVIGNVVGETYQDHRSTQVKLGLAADVLASVLAISLIVPATFAWIKKSHPLKSVAFAMSATFGMILATVFQLIVTAAFVLPNWAVVTSEREWRLWLETGANEDAEVGQLMTGFLPGYRKTINGFPVVQAVILPLGVVIACVAMFFFKQAENKAVEHAGSREEDKPAQTYVAPPCGHYAGAKA